MSITCRSFAKINLHLRVRYRRSDGYHELETLFQSIDLADRITVELIPRGIELRVRSSDLPADSTNLAYRAAAGYLAEFAPHSGVRMQLEKEIPVGGGLGGGSSNAATVLMALQELLGGPADQTSLFSLASRLGADVPFFLLGGTVLGTERGDRLHVVDDLPERTVWLVTPPVAVSTAEIFEHLELTGVTAPHPSDREWLEVSAWSEIEAGTNDLQETVMQRYPVVRDVYNALVEGGAGLVRLSGTGATVYAFFPEPRPVGDWVRLLPAGSRVRRTRTLTRSSLDRLRIDR